MIPRLRVGVNLAYSRNVYPEPSLYTSVIQAHNEEDLVPDPWALTSEPPSKEITSLPLQVDKGQSNTGKFKMTRDQSVKGTNKTEFCTKITGTLVHTFQ